MSKLLSILAASTALLLCAPAAAQGVPPGTPGVPVNDPMRPAAPPSGMEANDRVTNTALDDRIHKGLREKSGSSNSLRAVAAKPRDVIAGSAVRDSKGKAVGVIEAVGSDGAVLSTGTRRVRVPLEAFGKDKKGLLLGITKAEFEAAAANAS